MLKKTLITATLCVALTTQALAYTTAADLVDHVDGTTTGETVFAEGGQGETIHPHPYCLDLYRTNPYLRADDMVGILACSQNQWQAKENLGR